MIDTDKYEGHTPAEWMREMNLNGLYSHILTTCTHSERRLIEDAPLILQALIDERAKVMRLREDYENMSEVLRERGMDICRHCRVIYRDDDMNHPHYPTLHPWHMDGMCMKEMIE
jgi:hypothetical protein